MQQEDIYYIISNVDRNKFYKRMEYYVDTAHRAEKFITKDTAKYEMDHVLNAFQKDIFTIIIKIKITVVEI